MSKQSSSVKKNTRTFEQTLWDTADKLRGTVESSEYKHVVLSLIFSNSSVINSKLASTR